MNDLDWCAIERGVHYDNGNCVSALANVPTVTTTLNSSESETGQMVFDVPRLHGTIDYAPNFHGGVLARWRF